MSRPMPDPNAVFKYAEKLYRHIRSLRSTNGYSWGLIDDCLSIRWKEYQFKLSQCKTMTEKRCVADRFIGNLEFDQISLI